MDCHDLDRSVSDAEQFSQNLLQGLARIVTLLDKYIRSRTEHGGSRPDNSDAAAVYTTNIPTHFEFTAHPDDRFTLTANASLYDTEEGSIALATLDSEMPVVIHLSSSGSRTTAVTEREIEAAEGGHISDRKAEASPQQLVAATQSADVGDESDHGLIIFTPNPSLRFMTKHLISARDSRVAQLHEDDRKSALAGRTSWSNAPASNLGTDFTNTRFNPDDHVLGYIARVRFPEDYLEEVDEGASRVMPITALAPGATFIIGPPADKENSLGWALSQGILDLFSRYLGAESAYQSLSTVEDVVEAVVHAAIQAWEKDRTDFVYRPFHANEDEMSPSGSQ